jgi:hypothetical protein
MNPVSQFAFHSIVIEIARDGCWARMKKTGKRNENKEKKTGGKLLDGKFIRCKVFSSINISISNTFTVNNS